MRNKINKKAWAILKEEEQIAISLKIGHSKSTWEAGEVMGRAHYKFLEIEARAKHFLKMFTEHFELYNNELIPDYLNLDVRVKKYLRNVILKRLTAKEAADLVKDKEFSIKIFREELLITTLTRMVNSDRVIYNNIAILIFEFDRWNNWRILPLTIQEPSAFKRRNKNNDKRNIKNLISLSEYQIEKVIEKFEDDEGKLYMPMPSRPGDDSLGIIRVTKDDKVIAKLSEIGFFIFTKEDPARELYELIKGYDFFNTKTCIEGQKFWPKYRAIIRNSINYNAIGKRIASRKFLHSTLRDIDSPFDDNE